MAELDIAAGRFPLAFATLSEVTSAFTGSAYPREFTRTSRELLESVDWVTNHAKYKHFENVFHAHIHILSDLGEYVEVDRLLDKYDVTVAKRDARYINYCNLRCYAQWVQGEFGSALNWGKTGHDLKTSTGVDTTFDVAHNFALALRDAGRPEAALPIFLHGRNLSEVTDPKELDENRGGAHYGNIGRCLHFQGQIEQALVCYQKSALVLEKEKYQHVVNQGFIRAWIAELLMARNQFRLAYAFYRAAYLKWQHPSPPRAAQVDQVSSQLASRLGDAQKPEDDCAEQTCLDWILGKNIDEH